MRFTWLRYKRSRPPHVTECFAQDNCCDDQAKGFTARMEHIEASGKAILVENSNQ